jgi:hypothetical protein
VLPKDEFCSLKILDTAVYTAGQLDRALLQEANDEFHFATARTSEEAGKQIEAGFEYVCHHGGPSSTSIAVCFPLETNTSTRLSSKTAFSMKTC